MVGYYMIPYGDIIKKKGIMVDTKTRPKRMSTLQPLACPFGVFICCEGITPTIMVA